jgi:hypothetical protein
MNFRRLSPSCRLFPMQTSASALKTAFTRRGPISTRANGWERKLGADGGIGDYVTEPKGMHWRTFERAMERIDRAEGIVDGHKRKAIGHSNACGYSGIRVAKVEQAQPEQSSF